MIFELAAVLLMNISMLNSCGAFKFHHNRIFAKPVFAVVRECSSIRLIPNCVPSAEQVEVHLPRYNAEIKDWAISQELFFRDSAKPVGFDIEWRAMGGNGKTALVQVGCITVVFYVFYCKYLVSFLHIGHL